MSWLEGLAEPDWRVFHSDSEVQNIAKSALELMKEQEAVVRCKDCKHYNFKQKWCDYLSETYDQGEEWFCADGEKRDD